MIPVISASILSVQSRRILLPPGATDSSRTPDSTDPSLSTTIAGSEGAGEGMPEDTGRLGVGGGPILRAGDGEMLHGKGSVSSRDARVTLFGAISIRNR